MEQNEIAKSSAAQEPRQNRTARLRSAALISLLLHLVRYHQRRILLHAAVTVFFNLVVAASILMVMLRIGIVQASIFPAEWPVISSLSLSFFAVLFASLAVIGQLGLLSIESRTVVVEDERVARGVLYGHLALPPDINIPRATSYFGRLSRVIVIGCSSLTLLLAVCIATLVFMPEPLITGILIFMGSALILLATVPSTLGKQMKRSMAALLHLAPAISAWKLGKSDLPESSIKEYYGAYYRRLLLSSVFSLAKYVLLLLACSLLVMVFSDAKALTDSKLPFAFALLQLCGYCAVRVGNAVTQSMAFLHVVHPFLAHDQERFANWLIETRSK
ncbi:hypothetical protein N9C62_09775 [Luminiphilus sp.]|nr:hypothetical protein [Luminiphilus sp.]